jgi:hypothetical protein
MYQWIMETFMYLKKVPWNFIYKLIVMVSGYTWNFTYFELTSEWIYFCRYISTDSTNIVAYGFMDVNLDNDSVSMNHEDGCFSFFIPQV